MQLEENGAIKTILLLEINNRYVTLSQRAYDVCDHKSECYRSCRDLGKCPRRPFIHKLWELMARLN